MKSAIGADVPALALTNGLIDAMDAGSVRLDLASLVAHRNRLTNWKLADDALGRHSLSTAGVRRAYVEYQVDAAKAGLPVLAWPTFKLRGYSMPGAPRRGDD